MIHVGAERTKPISCRIIPCKFPAAATTLYYRFGNERKSVRRKIEVGGVAALVIAFRKDIFIYNFGIAAALTFSHTVVKLYGLLLANNPETFLIP